MPIEFRCTSCEKLLRVKDETAGKKAKCPSCGTVLEIPSSSEDDDYELDTSEPPPRRPDISAPVADSKNPFQAPTQYDSPQAGATAGRTGPIVPTRIDLGEVLSTSWEIFKSQMGLVIGGVVLTGVITQVVAQVLGFVGGLLANNAGDIGILFIVVAQLVGTIFSYYMTLGQTIFLVNIARGAPANIQDIFMGGPYLLRFLGAAILMGIGAMIGFLLLIIPGIIILLMFGQFVFLIVDKDMGIMDSLTTSKDITTGNKLTIFALGFVSLGIVLLGLLALCIGVIVAGPFVSLIFAVAYLRMAGQRTAID